MVETTGELEVVIVDEVEVVDVVVDLVDNARIPAPAMIIIMTTTTTIRATLLMACLKFFKVETLKVVSDLALKLSGIR